MNRKKILLISPLPPPVGGIASWTVNLLKYFSGKSESYEIFHQNTSLQHIGITKEDLYIRILLGFNEFRRVYSELKQNIKKNKPDVIHLTSSASLALIKDYFLIKLAKKNKIPVVMHWRFGRIPELAGSRNWEWKLLCRIIKASNTSIVIDTLSYECLTTAGIKNLIRIPNPLGLDVEEHMTRNTEKHTDKKPGSIIYAGHLMKRKGLFELVEACSRLPIVDELILAGPFDNGVRNELKCLANKRDQGLWLKIPGSLDKERVCELMHSSSLLALPSYTEGFPNVILEAMAMRCPIIATDVGAIPEMLSVTSEKPCGICVPVGDVEKLKEAILSLLEHPEEANQMGNNGIERVMNNYSFTEVVKQYESVWEKVYSV